MTPCGSGACRPCLRRARLLAVLASHLDHLHAARGMLDEVFALADGDLVDALVPDAAARRALLDRADAAGPGDALERAEAARAERAGLDVVCRHDPRYPAGLSALEGPPAALWVGGLARLAAAGGVPAAAIVGARRASPYGVEVARALGHDLGASGVPVVSGMALGVDSAAHAGALGAGGLTVAVLAGGADVPYPASKRHLYGEIRERGALVAELPPGFRPRRWAFPARNRIIAALTAVTVVVEAGERSGALITARVARDIGREVAAVPGRITSPVAAGANALLRDGACLVDGAQAVLDLLYGVGARRVPQAPEPALEPRLRRLLDAVRDGRDPASAFPCGGANGDDADPREVMAALGELELLGRVRRGPGGAWVAVAGRPRGGDGMT